MRIRKLVLSVCLVMALTMSLGGTIAYLSDTDSDVNVMTLGNVDIEQLEYERVVENGAWVSTGEKDKYNFVPDKIQEFTQGKPLYPAVFTDGSIKWDDRSGANVHQQSWGQIGGSGSNQLFDDSVKNVQDKFVFVKNTGKSDAYVRTLIAYELGAVALEDFTKVIETNENTDAGDDGNGHWHVEDVGVIQVQGNNFLLKEYTYLGAGSIQSDESKWADLGVLKQGAVSYPSLLQVYMKPEATNEDVEKIDGNKNGTYDILVVTQACQTMGFEGAAIETDEDGKFSACPAMTALDTAFMPVSVDSHPWIDLDDPEDEKDQDPDGVTIPKTVSTFADLKAAVYNGGNFVLTEDIEITDKDDFYYSKYVTGVMKDTTIDLNGHKIVMDVDMGSVSGAPVLFYVYKEGATLTIKGDGDVIAKHNAFIVFPRKVSGGAYIYGGNYYNIDETSGTDGDINAICYAQGGKVHIYGGTFTFKNVNGHCGAFNVYDNSGAEIVLHEGVLLSSNEYYKGSDADEIHLAEGCTLKEVVIDGETWYKVVKQ